MKANLKKHYENLLDIIAVYQTRISEGTANQEDIDDLAYTIAHAKRIKAKLDGK